LLHTRHAATETITQDDDSMLSKLKPLTDFPADDRRAVKFVLFDIDDTLTSGGRLTSEAYGALEDLKTAGAWGRRPVGPKAIDALTMELDHQRDPGQGGVLTERWSSVCSIRKLCTEIGAIHKMKVETVRCNDN
jgi:hypothetical protein